MVAMRGTRKQDWVAHNSFQQWADQRMTSLGLRPVDLHRAVLARGVEVAESYIYRVLRQAHRADDRIGYDLALVIGEILGDGRGALEAAGYRLPEPNQDTRLKEWIELYAGRDEQAQERLLSVVKQIDSMGKAA